MLAKAALVSYAGGFLGPLPDIVAFQYNPEQLTRTLTQRRAPAPGPGEPTQAEAYRVDGPPGETISFTAEFDANDAALDGNPVATAVGVRAQLAALELLLYSAGDQSLGALSRGVGSLLSSGAYNVPPDELPIVLFVWGPGRVLPVRPTTFKVREIGFDWLLNPSHASVDLTLDVLNRLPSDSPARGVYDYTERQMRAVARLQLVNDVQSVLSAL